MADDELGIIGTIVVGLGAICCIICIAIIVIPLTILIMHFVNKGSECEGQFTDIPSSTFYVTEKYLTLKNEAFVQTGKAMDGDVGKYFEVLGKAKREFRFQYRNESNDEKRVVAEVIQELLSIGRDYDIEICDGSIRNFKIDQKFNLLEKEFDIEQADDNGDYHVIARSSKKIFFTFKPDITVVDTDGELIGYCGRDIPGSLVKDEWECKNFQSDILPNFMLGLLAYLETIAENEDRHSKKNIGTCTTGLCKLLLDILGLTIPQQEYDENNSDYGNNTNNVNNTKSRNNLNAMLE